MNVWFRKRRTDDVCWDRNELGGLGAVRIPHLHISGSRLLRFLGIARPVLA